MLLTAVVMAGSYKAKVEPYDAYVVTSEATGKIVKLDQKHEMQVVDGVVLKIDTTLESIRLKNSKTKLKLLKEQIALKKAQYNSIKDLRSQNRFTKEQYKSAIITLQMQEADLKSQIAQLKDTISKKSINLKSKYIKALYVRKGEFVGVGTKLMRVEDLSGARVVVYVSMSDLQNINKAEISVDGESGWSVEKSAKSPDDTYLSLYRIELVKSGVNSFGKVVNVEIN